MADASWLDHTADVGAKLRAGALEDLFDAALEALVAAMMTEPPRAADDSHDLRLEAPDLESLMVRWLEEWVYRIQGERRVPVRATLEIAESRSDETETPVWRLFASVRDAPLDPRVHGWRTEVKGVTYHGLRVEEDGDGWHASIVFDV